MSQDKEVLSLQDDKIIVIKPKNTDNIVPLFCMSCCLPMKTIEDAISYRKNKVCNSCANHWPEGKLIDKSSEEWKEYMEIRLLQAKTLITFR